MLGFLTDLQKEQTDDTVYDVQHESICAAGGLHTGTKHKHTEAPRSLATTCLYTCVCDLSCAQLLHIDKTTASRVFVCVCVSACECVSRTACYFLSVLL